MKRLLISTTALAVALSGVPTLPAMAQNAECTAENPCPEQDDKAAKKAARQAEKEKAKAAEDAKAKTAEDDAAKAAKKAEREAAKAAEKAAADEKAATTPPAEPTPPEVVPEPKPTPAAEPTPEPTPETATDTDDDKAAKKAEKKAEKKAAKDAAATQDPVPETATPETAETDPAAGDAPDTADDDAMTKAEKKAAKRADANAAPETPPEPLPEPTPEAATALEGILATPAAQDSTPAAPAAAAGVKDKSGKTKVPEAAPVATTETVLTEDNTRSSREEFRGKNNGNGNGNNNNNNFGNGVNSGENQGNVLGENSRDNDDRDQKREKFRDRDDNNYDNNNDDDDDGLSDFEKFGLLALGALAVGMILTNGDRVVQNTGDRVVVSRSDGSYQVWRDDDTLIRQPGSTVRTETFGDGSTRTTVTRTDGSRIVTIRDVSGRVLRRVLVDPYGRETLLIDDLTPVQPIDVTTLPRRPEITLSASNDPAQLEAALLAARSGDAARGYSLAQVRDLREVRALAPRIDVAPITFGSGSSAIDAAEAEKLADLGGLIARMIAERPNELFLVEGHTDAVGDAASNLALSDRRAESVALALTEYFDVPPENLVVQGYGEGDLLVPTAASEPANRRVAVRVITPLLAASR